MRGLTQLAEALDKQVATALFGQAPKKCAERIVRELQERGPSWTGAFSNSWRITSVGGDATGGSGVTGEPQYVPAPLLSGIQLLRSGVKYEITNVSPIATYALDLESSTTWRQPGGQPQTAKGQAAWKTFNTGRKPSSKRGEAGGGGAGQSSQTAELDWFTKYLDGGAFNNAVKLEVDTIFRNLPK